MTTRTAVTKASTPGPAKPPSPLQLTLLHARMQFLETVRVPIAILSAAMFPALAAVFFVIPNEQVAGDPVGATAAIAQLGVFAIMSACLFTHGIGVAEDRALPFDGFVRTLPAGALPRLVGRVLNGLIFAAISLIPLITVGALLTEASLSLGRLIGAVAMVLAVAVPFTFLGLAIGYALSSKAAVAVVQVVLFPLAFAGGLFLPPQLFPGWMDVLSMALPSRAARDVMVQVATGEAAYGLALPLLVVWTVIFALLAVWAYRRDEGRRFR